MKLSFCIKLPFIFLSLFASLSTTTLKAEHFPITSTIILDTEVVPYTPKKSDNDFLDEPETKHVAVPQATFIDLAIVLIKTLLIVFGFIALLYGAIYFFKRLNESRFQSRTSGEDLKILERAVISSKSAIYLLEVKNKYFLVGESHNGLSNLGSFYNENP